MNRVRRLLPVILLVAAGLVTTLQGAQERPDRVRGGTIEWPSAQFPDLQAAINAAPDRATIRIGPGTYTVSTPLYVRNKHLTLVGAGSGRAGKRRLTQFAGPQPTLIDGRVAPVPANVDSVVGLWNFVASEVLIQNMSLSGFDAGIVIRDDPPTGGETALPGGPTAPGRPTRFPGPPTPFAGGHTVIKDVVIAQTGHGILSRSSSDLTVKDCTIMSTQGNGISVAPKLVHPYLVRDLLKFTVGGTKVINPKTAGMYFENAIVQIHDVSVSGAKLGGIVGVSIFGTITDSLLWSNAVAGILLWDSTAVIANNVILNSTPIPASCGHDPLPPCKFGDGITLIRTFDNGMPPSQVTGNDLLENPRVGLMLFGATASVENNYVSCNMIPLAMEEFKLMQPEMDDAGGNWCGCGIDKVTCQVDTPGMQAPEPM